MSEEEEGGYHPAGPMVVTIASDGMEPLNTNGTNEIVPPDSPKRGDLFLLNTTLAVDGEIDIQRTLVDAGTKEPCDETSDATDTFIVQAAAAEAQHTPPPPPENGGTEEKQLVSEQEPQEQQQLEQPEQHQEPQEQQQQDDQKQEQQQQDAQQQEQLEQQQQEHQQSEQQQPQKEQELNSSAPPIENHREEVLKAEERSGEDTEMSCERETAKPTEAQHDSPEAQKADSTRNPDVEDEEPKTDLSKMPEESGVSAQSTSNVKPKSKRTMTLPAGTRLTLPWQKKQQSADTTADDQNPKHRSKSPKPDSSSASSSVGPLSAVMRNLKKGFKIKVGSGNKGGEEPAPGRIPQKSGPRPSPRIVSSLSITNQEPVQAEPPTEQESPATRRRKLLDEVADDILSAMPPSPAPSTESVKNSAEASSPVYDNLPTENHNEKVHEIPTEEEEICPSIASKPVLEIIGQAANEQRARKLMDSLANEGTGKTAEESDASVPKPPRPPPARSGQSSPTKSSPRNLPPPPRPSAPPRVLQKSYTMVADGSRSPGNSDIIAPTAASKPVCSEPVQMNENYENYTTSLDRRKLYRSKEETKMAKRETLSRPATMHETTFTVKHKVADPLHQSFDDAAGRPRACQKVVFERRETITFPKLTFGSKKKSTHPPPVARPHLASTPSTEGHRASALKSIAAPDDVCVKETVGNVQCALPQPGSVMTSSIGTQTTVDRPEVPLTSLRRGFSPVKGSPPASQSFDAEFELPYLGKRLVEKVGTEGGRSSLNAFRSGHSVWSQEADQSVAEETASEHLVNRCLQEYMAVCIRLRSADLQGEFAAFHWHYGDVGEAKCFKHGAPIGWPSIEVYYDPLRLTDFVKLASSDNVFLFLSQPQVQYSVGHVVYPERTVDAMLATWIDIGRTHAPSTPHCPVTPTAEETVFHPAVAILRLSDILHDINTAEELPPGIRSSVTLAVLLSVDQCSADLQNAEDNVYLNLDPSDILLLCSPANCLVLFRVITAESENEEKIKSLLQQLNPEHAGSLTEAINAGIEDLSVLAYSRLSVSAMFQAIAPPDWVMQAVARTARGKGVTAPPLEVTD
ncbi:unnamed protein product [Mesocestoides corti]|uniref:Uncharacterized protein n=1 Tax=Mesocestoides corti TaxID=53468 RepID=A0A158QSZ3_MESCO|nr:unnamed protein product [Mesocestoides corti]